MLHIIYHLFPASSESKYKATSTKMADSEMVASYRHMNSLVYARPSSGSLINERTQKLSYPASLSYSLGSTMQFVINSGSESVWGPSSYIKLKCRITTTANDFLISGSFYNLFSQVRLYHKSGELLSQIFFSDILSNIKLRYMTSTSDYQKLYTLIGGNAVIGTPDKAGATVGDTTGAGLDVYYMLPLSMLFGEFDNHSQYIPATLLAGARMELVLNGSVAECGMSGTNLSVSAIIPVLSLDCSQLYDAVQKQLMEESADVQASGIQFTYSTFFSSQSAAAAGAINIDVLQSASLTEKVFVTMTATGNDAGLTKYDFLPINTNGQFSYQWRIGSHYLPIYAVQDNTEAFQQAQIAFNGAYNQYRLPPTHTGISVSSFGTKNAVYATSLEKSACDVALSGEPTNNSRIVNFSAQGNAGAFKTTVFLQYVRVSNLMLDSCVVDR